jgi:hypothetical protein
MVPEEINHAFLHVFMIEELVCTDRVSFIYHKYNLIVLYSEASQDVVKRSKLVGDINMIIEIYVQYFIHFSEIVN